MAKVLNSLLSKFEFFVTLCLNLFKGKSIISQLEFAVNDAMSVSYSQEKYKRIDKTMAATATTHTESSVEAEADYIQVAYNIGGATVGIAMVDTDNSDYVDNKE